MKTRKGIASLVALAALSLMVAACSKAGSTPTATMKAFYDATKSKDVQGMKNALSKGSLAMMESFAKMDNKSLDDMLKEPNSSKMPSTFEARNEVITGDTATLEVKDEKGNWEKTPFVKEDGQWKIAIDKAFEQGLGGGGSTTGGPTDGPPAAGTSPGMGGNTNSNSSDNANKGKSESEESDKENGNDSDHGSH